MFDDFDLDIQRISGAYEPIEGFTTYSNGPCASSGAATCACVAQSAFTGCAANCTGGTGVCSNQASCITCALSHCICNTLVHC